MAETSAAEAPPKEGVLSNLRSASTGFWFMSPAAILVILFFFIPSIIIFGLSLTNLSTATGFQNWEWVGLENYRKIFVHPDAGPTALRTVFYVITTLTIFNVGMALVVAILTTHIPRRSGFAFRALWLLPRITPSVIYIMMWKYMAAAEPYGILNRYLPFLSGNNLIPDAPWVFVILTNGYIGASFGMILFASAIESIPKDFMNAALVDGCNVWQRIRYLILPAIRWPLLFVCTFQTLSLMTSFEQIFILTDGQFGTEVWALWAYHRALSNYWGNFQWGFGAALAVVLVIIGAVAAVVYMRFFQFNELVQEPRIDAL
jgi:inositol-phosphate transport system permease protein